MSCDGTPTNEVEEANRKGARARLDAQVEANYELRRTNPAAWKAKIEARMPENSCCFCRETFRGYGNHPYPVLKEGTACDDCNFAIVVPQRFRQAGRV